jgi:hypothetical protein
MIFQKSQQDYYIQTIRKNKDQLDLKDKYYTLYKHLVICACANGGSPNLATNNVALAKEYRVTPKTIYNRLNVLMKLGLIHEKKQLSKGFTLLLDTSIFDGGRKVLPPLISSKSRITNNDNKDLRKNVEKEFGDLNEEILNYALKTVEHLLDKLYGDTKHSKNTIEEATKILFIDYFSVCNSRTSAHNTYFKLCRLIDGAKGWLSDKPEFVLPGVISYLKGKNGKFNFHRLIVLNNARSKSKKIRTLRHQIKIGRV